MIAINQADANEINLLVPLFNDYRSFYRHPIDPLAKNFLEDRLRNKESVVFLAMENNEAVGFVQLYPSFSSRSLGRIWVLNDLYIAPAHRRKKIASKLIEHTLKFAKEDRAVFVSLSTEIANTQAQELYKKIGFKKDNDFFHYAYRF